MIILDATTKSLQITLSGAVTTNQLPFAASYVDSTGTATTPGEQDGTSNSTTAVTVVSSPASSTQRLIKNIVIQNADTASATVTVIYNNNSTLRNIVVATLAVGDQLIYEDGHGWSTVDTNGCLKTSSVSSGGSIPSGTILPYAGSSAPSGFLLCYGQLVSTTTYAALYTVLGTTYGSGSGTFGIPDLRGRLPAGVDNMGGTAANRITSANSGITGTSLGASGGNEQLFGHTHTATVTDSGHSHGLTRTTTGNNAGGSNSYALAATGTPQYDTVNSSTTGISVSNASTGGGSSQNVQPTIMLNYIIKT
jgi:microcystin-dependent protein